MEQGSKDWLEWRQQGIGSSDAPVIMGVSPYKKLQRLWEEKLGLTKQRESTFIMRRGNRMEPVARAAYELETGMRMPPAVGFHSEFPFLRVSLDGFNEDANILLEIKYAGKKDHALAIDGKVPDKYWPQIQHQLLVTGALEAHYFSYNESKGSLVKVPPDFDYIKDLLARELHFWNVNIMTRLAPSEDQRWI